MPARCIENSQDVTRLNTKLYGMQQISDAQKHLNGFYSSVHTFENLFVKAGNLFRLCVFCTRYVWNYIQAQIRSILHLSEYFDVFGYSVGCANFVNIDMLTFN